MVRTYLALSRIYVQVGVLNHLVLCHKARLNRVILALQCLNPSTVGAKSILKIIRKRITGMKPVCSYDEINSQTVYVV